MYWAPFGKDSWETHLSLLVDEDEDGLEGGLGFHAFCSPIGRG